MSQKTDANNRQVKRTRMWIFEALMLLLEEKPYSKISVSDITARAGIARQTFYRNYSGKDDIISEYLSDTISLEPEAKKRSGQGNIVLTFNIKYMMENRENIKKMLSIVEIEHRIRNEAKEFPITMMGQFRGKLSAAEFLKCRYKLYYQLIGCLQAFFDWFINDMPMPVEEVVAMLNALNVPNAVQYRDIPGIVVRIQ